MSDTGWIIIGAFTAWTAWALLREWRRGGL